MGKFNFRKIILLLADIFIIIVSGVTLNYVLSLTKIISAEASGLLFYYMLISVLCCMLFMLLFGSYTRLWRYFNIRDYVMCAVAMTLGFAMSYGVLVLIKMPPRKIFFVLFYLIATAGVLLFRFAFKTTFLKLTRSGQIERTRRTMIVGAGQAGRMILTEIKNAHTDAKNPSAEIEPVCFVDDDTTKLHTKIYGVEVVGVCAEIPKICTDYYIDEIIVAVPSCEEEEKRKILDYCSSTKCEIKVIPYLSELLLGDASPQLLTQAKDIKIEDLLGRKPIEFNRNKIAQFI